MENRALKPEKKLGFGLMRLPLLEDKSIDMAHVCEMVDAFLKAGFTYFDTAYNYHGGNSEPTACEALVKRHPREAYTLATKMPAWILKDVKSTDTIFEDQLRKTGVDYFDYYLLHAVGGNHLAVYDEYDCWNWGLRKKAEGKIRWFGFSFHDTAELLDELLTKHPEVDFVQLQINYLDWDNEIVQSAACYEVATKHGKPVIVMEPVKGGTLAAMPEAAAGILKNHAPDASLPSWALRYCASLENVMMVLSGMSDREQMADNCRTMADFHPLTAEEQALISQTAEQIRKLAMVPCTACRYCEKGCPQSIRIPDIIQCLNHVKVYGDRSDMKERYEKLTAENGLASSCVGCGQCEQVCPQHIGLIKVMAEAAAMFEEAK